MSDANSMNRESSDLKHRSVNQSDALHTLLNAVAKGEVSPAVAFEKLKNFTYESVGDFAKIDHHRSLRTGFPEAVWGQGKTPEQIAQIMAAMRTRAERNAVVDTVPIMATRIEPQVFAEVQQKVVGVRYYPTARICAIAPETIEAKYAGTMGLICAGTSDLPVAEEAAITAQLCGFRVQRLWDVGVAGIHRLLDNQQVLRQADVLVVVAGMEGALPSVVAGLADCPVIAVPTSIGYGASFNGLAPLLTMLNSCAPGVGVVNIDNGFGAAVLAGQILRTAERFRS